MRRRTPLSVGLAIVGAVFLGCALAYAIAVRHEDLMVLWILIGVALAFGAAAWIIRLLPPR